MPMYRDSVPKAIRPWIYVCFAIIFQLTGGVYLAALSPMMGTTALLREDLQMVQYFSLVGVSMPFPLLFRLKFRFTNRQLLLTAATVELLCTLLATVTTQLPLLCLLAYLSGFFKLCGTFECMSNIQLWMTPKRDFTIFFPLLYCIVLGDQQLASWLVPNVNYAVSWHAMHWLIIGLLLLMIITIVALTRNFHFLPKRMPLYGMDWLGCILWSTLLLEIIYIFNYGEHLNWFASPRLCVVTLALVPTFSLCIGRMRHVRHPYIAPEAWGYKNLGTLLSIFALCAIIGAVPNVVQSFLTSGVLHFGSTVTARLGLIGIVGVLAGNAFSYWFTHRLRLSYVRLISVGFAAMVIPNIALYFSISPADTIEMLYMPTFLRVFGNTVIFCVLTIYLEEIMPFQHFFMGLTILGMVRTGTFAAIGSALYSFGLRYLTADAVAAHSAWFDPMRLWQASDLGGGTAATAISQFMIQMKLAASKQLYGFTAIFGSLLVLVLLMYSTKVRSTLKRMPYWEAVSRQLKKTL